MTIQSLYTFGNAANVSANNFTTLYNTGAGVVNPQMAYGNANVVGLLAVGTDGGNTITDIVATGNIYADNIFANIVGNLNVPGNTGEVLFNSSGNAGASANFTFDTATDVLNVTGNVQATYFIGDGSQLTGLPSGYSNAQVAAYLASGTNTSNIITSGNVSGQYILGDGSQLTGITTNYSNANVVSLMANFGSNVISTTGNITGGYILGNGALLTGIAATYGNANVAAFLPTYTGDLAGANLSLTGNAVVDQNISASGSIAAAGNIRTTGGSGNITGADYISANYFVGNGALLTGIATSYGDSNVVTLLASFGSNTISTTGSIAAGSLSTSGNVTVSGNLVSDDITSTGVTVYGDQVITGNLTVQGTTTTINSNVVTTNDKTITVANNQSTGANVNGAGIEAGSPAIATWLYNAATDSWQSNIAVTPTGNGTQDLGKSTNQWATVYSSAVSTTGNVSAGGNVIGAYLYGDGSNITGVVAGAASTRFAVKNTSGGTLTKGTPVYATGTVGASTVLEIAASRADTPSTMPTIGLLDSTLAINDQGYAISVGTLTTVNTSTFTTGQELYVAATGGVTTARPTGANVVQTIGAVGRVDSTNGSIETNIWNSYGLPNLTNGKIWQGNATGYPTEVTPYGDSNVVTLMGTFGSNIISTTGNISGGYFLGNGSQLTGLPATYNDSNVATFLAAFGANTISTTGTVTAGNITGGNILTGGIVSAVGNITAPYFIGNGSQLTGIVATSSYGDSNVATFLSAYGANTFSSTGNVTANNLIATTHVSAGGNVSVGQNVNVPNGFVSATGNVRGGNINTGGLVTATGNITGGNIDTGGIVSAVGDVIGGNILTAGIVSATGNITGNYFFGNGSQLTGITGGGTPTSIVNGTSNVVAAASGNVTIGVAGTAAVATYATTGEYISGLVSATGNITGGNLISSSRVQGVNYSETVYAYGNTGAATITPNISLGSIQQLTLTGNITLSAITNIQTGQNMTLILTQDATGSRLLTSTMKFSGGFKTLSTAANSIDIMTVFYDGSTYYASLSRGYA